MFEITKQTAFETTESVATVLDWKLEQAKEKNLPVEETLADYIALGVGGYDGKIAQLKDYKNQIQEAINEIEEHKSKAMQEAHGWLVEQGIEKLKGIHVSSITCKEAGVSITKKFVLDVDRETLVEKGLAHFEEVIKETPATIRINKKRTK
jgi:hypothetical protein